MGGSFGMDDGRVVITIWKPGADFGLYLEGSEWKLQANDSTV